MNYPQKKYDEMLTRSMDMFRAGIDAVGQSRVMGMLANQDGKWVTVYVYDAAYNSTLLGTSSVSMETPPHVGLDEVRAWALRRFKREVIVTFEKL